MAELRPLGEIMDSLEQIGFTVSYAFDDLIFIEQLHFLLRFDEHDTHKLEFFAHHETEENKQLELFNTIAEHVRKDALIIENAGTFELSESRKEEGNLDIVFYEINRAAV